MSTSLLNLVKGLTPVFLRRLRGQRAEAFDSAEYWEERYRNGGTSGAGSYNRLAHFKADFLNEFVAENGIRSVIEFGSGDGSQLELAQYPEYVGIDVSPIAVGLCRRKFHADKSKKFYVSGEMPMNVEADVSLSLDVIYHLVEDSVFETYMNDLFRCARRFVIVYASNEDASTEVAHVRHRNFTNWVHQYLPDWHLQSVTRNPFPYNPTEPNTTSFSDFYVFARWALNPGGIQSACSSSE